MPTLVNHGAGDHNRTIMSSSSSHAGGGEETAGTSAMRWVAENLDCRPDLGNETNDNTWSGSYLESALGDVNLRRDEEGGRQRESSSNEQSRSNESTHVSSNQRPFQNFGPQILSPQSLSRTMSDDDGNLLCTQRPSSTMDAAHADATTPNLEQTPIARTCGRPIGLSLDGHSSVPCSQSYNDDSMSKTLNEEDIAIHLSNQHQQKKALSPEFDNTIATALTPPHRHQSLSPDFRNVVNRAPRPERKMGPNEKLYTEQYSGLIADHVRSFQDRYPGQLRDYHAMSDDDKRKEQERVIRLLQRLKTISIKENVEEHDDDVCVGYRSKNPAARGDVQEESDISSDEIHETSELLLSPVLTQQSQQSKLVGTTESQIQLSPIAMQQDAEDTSMETSPIKQAVTGRDSSPVAELFGSSPASAGDHHYESPETVRREMKRLASTSGKRGADLVRLRLSVDEDECSNDGKVQFTTPSKGLANSIGRLSLADESIFSSSQSPIVPRTTHSPVRNDDSPADYPVPDISFGDNEHDDARRTQKPGVDNDSLIETAMLPDKRVRWDFDGRLTKEAPTDVRLLGGKAMQWPKLPTNRLQRTAPPTQSFTDPLSLYPEKLQRRMKRLYRWLHQLDRSSVKGSGSAVFLSLTEQMIVDLILKLQLDCGPASEQQGPGENGLLSGNTLIIGRSKDDLEIWGRSFREGSSCSVLNHAVLPMSQRKSPTTSEYAVQFDVVLTTYDALKSPDVTLTLDGDGFVTNQKTGLREGGWYSSASQAIDVDDLATKKQLSALHRVSWRRLVFLDVLSRKSYLAKADTARVYASTALNSNARLAFFVSDESGATGADVLLKIDRTVCQSLCSALRLDKDHPDEEAIRSHLIDFQDKSTYLAMTAK